MKRLWKKPIELPVPSRIEAQLGPHEVTVRRYAWPFRSSRAERTEPVLHVDGQPLWAAAVAALEQGIQNLKPRAGQLQVTMSSRFVRCLLVPAHPELKKIEEQTGYARHFFVERFGPEAEHWVIRLSATEPGGQLFACAIDRGLMDELNRIANAHRLTLDLVEPAIVKAFNANGGRIASGSCWFVVMERDVAGIGLVDKGVWRSVAIRRLASPLDENLARIISTEQQVTGVEPRVERAMVAGYCFSHDFPKVLNDLKVEVLPDCGTAVA